MIKEDQKMSNMFQNWIKARMWQMKSHDMFYSSIAGRMLEPQRGQNTYYRVERGPGTQFWAGLASVLVPASIHYVGQMWKI